MPSNTTTAATDNKSVIREDFRGGKLLQRKCPCGGEVGPSGECEECNKKKLLQRRASGPTPIRQVPSIVHDVISSPGRPLDATTRAFMEPRFGRGFSSVRIHDDARAAASARAVNAHAWAVGDHIAFAPGKYDPHSTPGRHLLAHELAHTVQQSGLQRSGNGLEMASGHEDTRLETDADATANRVMSGIFSGHVVSRTTRPTLSKAGAVVSETAVTQNLTVTWQDVTQTFSVTREDSFSGGGSQLEMSFSVDKALIPQSKGASGVTKYEQAAAGGTLQCVLEMASSGAVQETAAWQERDDTDTMRTTWLTAAGLTPATADAAWNTSWIAAGGAAPSAALTFPRTPSGTCQMDHIIELQYGGGNNAENLMPLDGVPNRHSGGFLRGQAWALASAIAGSRTLTSSVPRQIRLRFRGVQSSPYVNTVPAPDCLRCAAAMRTAAGATPAAAGVASTTPYNLTARASSATTGGVNATVQLPNGTAAGAVVNIYDDPTNRAAGLLVSGLILKTLTKGRSANQIDRVSAELDTASDRRTRLPISLRGAPASIPLDVEAQPTGVLRQRTSTVNIPYTFPFLSPGTITRLSISPEGQLAFRGTLNPTVPFLPREVNVQYENEVFSITSRLDPATLRPPIPGFRVTDASIGLQLSPTFSASGNLGFALGSGARPAATGSVTLGADTNGVTATGTVRANIPGVNEASGTVRYANGTWTGQIVVESSQISLPYVQNARLVLDMDNTGLRPSGEVSLLFPRELGTATLGFSREENRFVYTGRGRFRVPGLHEIDARVRYDGVSLTASAENIGFTWRGLNGTMGVTYTAREGGEGTVTGNGTLTFTRGDFTGTIEARLGNTGRFSGRGTLRYPFNFRGTRIDATAGIIIGEDQSVRVEGAIRLPQPVQLFRRFGERRSLFDIRREIPIPGASIGPVGLVAVIEGGIGVNYGVGPGELRNVAITAAFNPMAANPDPNVSFHCDLHIPAEAGITGRIGGGLGVSAGIASVTGTINVTAALNLTATAGGPLDANYSNSRVEISARPGINAALNLGLSLDAIARAQAGIGSFSVETSKTWNLGRRNINLSQFSMAVPIRYASNEDFRAPSMSDIEWGPPPQIDFENILQQLFNGASASETTA
jgi:Domain of unknown function (DUF4157)